jgi:hypothetical protein
MSVAGRCFALAHALRCEVNREAPVVLATATTGVGPRRLPALSEQPEHLRNRCLYRSTSVFAWLSAIEGVHEHVLEQRKGTCFGAVDGTKLRWAPLHAGTPPAMKCLSHDSGTRRVLSEDVGQVDLASCFLLRIVRASMRWGERVSERMTKK